MQISHYMNELALGALCFIAVLLQTPKVHTPKI